jgi:hypothetical protein
MMQRFEHVLMLPNIAMGWPMDDHGGVPAAKLWRVTLMIANRDQVPPSLRYHGGPGVQAGSTPPRLHGLGHLCEPQYRIPS